jgi:hypothetical protein
MNELPKRLKERIELEERYRFEIRETLVPKRTVGGKIFDFFNSQFGMWFLTTIVVAGMTSLWAYYIQVRSVDRSSASKFAVTVTAVRIQCHSALTAISRQIRESSVSYAASQPTLKENDFIEFPSSDVINDWDNALSVIEAYANYLSGLSSPKTPKADQHMQQALGEAFLNAPNQLTPNGLPAQLSAELTQVGEIALKKSGRPLSSEIALETDPSIANIFHILAKEIGETKDQLGMRSAIKEVYFSANLSDLNVRFLSTSSPTDKTALAEDYAKLLQNRSLEDDLLLNLRRSLLALADAHNALAHGSSAGVQSSLQIVEDGIRRNDNTISQLFSATQDEDLKNVLAKLKALDSTPVP